MVESAEERGGEIREEDEGEYNNNKGPNWDIELPLHLWSCILKRLESEEVTRFSYVSESCRYVVDQALLKNDYYLNERVWASSPGIVVCIPSDSGINDFGVEISYMGANNDERGRRLMNIMGIGEAHLVAPSINGLICATNFDVRPTTVLCNPTTGESLTLPVPPACASSSFQKFGFGYSPSTDEYKFVQLCLKRCGPEDYRRIDVNPSTRVIDCRVLTLSLSSSSSSPHDKHQHQHQQQRSTDGMDNSSAWRRIEHSIGIGYDEVVVDGWNSGSVYADGVIYWPCFTSTPWIEPYAPRSLTHFILSFHVRDEIFTVIPSPPPPGHPYRSYLAEVQGRLCVGRLWKRVDFGYELDVWMLTGPGSWIRYRKIGLDLDILDFDDYELRQSVLYFDFSCLSRDKVIFILNYEMSIYDVESESWVERFPLKTWPSRPVASPIKESMLSLRQAKICVV